MKSCCGFNYKNNNYDIQFTQRTDQSILNSSIQQQQNQSLFNPNNNSIYENGYYDIYEFVRKGQINSVINFHQYTPFQYAQLPTEIKQQLQADKSQLIKERTFHDNLFKISAKSSIPDLSTHLVKQQNITQSEFTDINILNQDRQNRNEANQKLQFLKEQEKYNKQFKALTQLQTNQLRTQYNLPFTRKQSDNQVQNLSYQKKKILGQLLSPQSKSERQNYKYIYKNYAPKSQQDFLQRQDYIKSLVEKREYIKELQQEQNKISKQFKKQKKMLDNSINSMQSSNQLPKLKQRQQISYQYNYIKNLPTNVTKNTEIEENLNENQLDNKWQKMEMSDFMENSLPVQQNDIVKEKLDKSKSPRQQNQQIQIQVIQDKNKVLLLNSSRVQQLFQKSNEQKRKEYVEYLEQKNIKKSIHSLKNLNSSQNNQNGQEKPNFINIIGSSDQQKQTLLSQNSLFLKKEPDSPKKRKSYFQRLQEEKEKLISKTGRCKWFAQIPKKFNPNKDIFMPKEPPEPKKRKSYFIDLQKQKQQEQTQRSWQVVNTPKVEAWQPIKILDKSEDIQQKFQHKRKSHFQKLEKPKFIQEKGNFNIFASYKPKNI